MGQLRAAIFDIGGVLTTSPVVAIRDWAYATGVDYAVLGPMLNLPDGAWARYERSVLSEAEFCRAIEDEGRAHGIEVTGKELQRVAFGGQHVRDEMVAVVRHLRGRVPIGCITNNVRREDSRPRGLIDLHSLFDVVVESAVVGLRKPDPRIYQMACEGLGVEVHEAVFLDDMGTNLKGARAIGMATIKVDHTHSAIEELEAALGLSLPRPLREAAAPI